MYDQCNFLFSEQTLRIMLMHTPPLELLFYTADSFIDDVLSLIILLYLAFMCIYNCIINLLMSTDAI